MQGALFGGRAWSSMTIASDWGIPRTGTGSGARGTAAPANEPGLKDGPGNQHLHFNVFCNIVQREGVRKPLWGHSLLQSHFRSPE